MLNAFSAPIKKNRLNHKFSSSNAAKRFKEEKKNFATTHTKGENKSMTPVPWNALRAQRTYC